jgi:hypothetical protein
MYIADMFCPTITDKRKTNQSRHAPVRAQPAHDGGQIPLEVRLVLAHALPHATGAGGEPHNHKGGQRKPLHALVRHGLEHASAARVQALALGEV